MRKVITAAFAALFMIMSVGAASALTSDCAGYTIQVNNYTDEPIYNMQASCVDCENWSGNLLTEPVWPGEWQIVDVSGAPGTEYGYHVFDFYLESDTIEWTATFDLCRIDTLNVR